MTWTVYILLCSDNSLYTGITTDAERRVNEHNHDNKKGAKYTKNRRPVTKVYQETCLTRSEASRREHQIKKLTRNKKQQLIQSGAAS